jgi:hypothetical protein
MEENNNVEVLNQQPTTQPVQQPVQEPVQQPVQQPTYTAPAAPVKPSVPEEYTPVGVGAYIGYTLLFGIPCIGLIAALVIAFGGNKKISLKNYAKAYLLILLIAIVATVLMVVIGGAAVFNIFNQIAESSNYGLGA